MRAAPAPLAAPAAKAESLERPLWRAADNPGENIDAAECRHLLLGLTFVKDICDSFEEVFKPLAAGLSAGADTEGR